MPMTVDERVHKAAEAQLNAESHVAAVDVLQGTALLARSHYFEWIDGRIPVLETAMSAHPFKIGYALQAFAEWGRTHNLRWREAVYFSSTRHPWQLCCTEDPQRVPLYTHRFFSLALSEEQIERIHNELSSPPQLVVFEIIADSKCSRCSREIPRGGFLFKESGQPLCLDCAELGTHVFLGAGDRNLSRRARELSSVSAAVLRFSRARKRYERQGLLVEGTALQQAESELGAKAAQPTQPPPKARRRVMPRSANSSCVYQLKITLLDVAIPVWRRVLVPGLIDLPRLTRVVQRSMGWSNNHLQKLEFNLQKLCNAEHPDHRDAMEWLGEDFDPKELDLIPRNSI